MTGTTALGPERFGEFYAALHSDGGSARTPFPWQQRLVEQVATTGSWPDLIDLPTASGKTTTIEIALYLLAAGVDVPRRIVFVVDRRIVVSQAARVARNAADRLRPSSDGILGEVARGLQRLAPSPGDDLEPDRPVLHWAELRGGISRDEQWATRPDVPAVVVSTVDQVGSRLLFRGYGVTRGMAPVHAGLLGTDCLFLLDEVHLSAPFAQTLRSVERTYRRPFPGQDRAGRWKAVELSATPSSPPGAVRFSLDDADRDPGIAPMLARRLATRKPARLVEVPVSGRDEAAHRGRLAASAAAEAVRLVVGGATTVGVIVNRVETAREARRILAARDNFDVCLLTGRMRGLDRDDLLAEVGPRLAMGRTRRPEDRPLVMVATQAVEAGADFDLDAVVTECASLDALQQRFGRVRRDGLPLEPTATSVVLATSASVADGADDAVYGGALRETWRALVRAGDPLDLGPAGFGRLRAEADPERVSSAALDAPVLFARHLDLWSQTSQRPSVDPDPALWLHGLVAPRPEVALVWRADLPDLRLEEQRPTTEDTSWADELADELSEVVGAVAPGSAESVSLPLVAVAAWLEGLTTPAVGGPRREADQPGSIADVDAGAESVSEPTGPRRVAPVLRWAGEHSSLAVARSDLRPGDVIVVPAVYGGIGYGTFDPASRDPVSDRATEVAARQRRRAVLRLRAGLLPAAFTGVGQFPILDEEVSADADRAAAAAWLTDAGTVLVGAAGDGAMLARQVVASLVRDLRRQSTARRVLRRQDPLTEAGGPYLVLVGSTLLPRTPESDEADTVDEDTPELTGTVVGLDTHLGDVAGWAEQLARNCGLPADLVHDIALAARLHDVGKADPRFQLILAGGVPPGGDAPLLAKSADSPDLGRRRELRRQARYPQSTRHEMTSVSLIDAHPDVLAAARDRDLVLHLVGSHHGWGRPFAPVVVDDSTDQVDGVVGAERYLGPVVNDLHRLGSGVAERFWTLTRRYGWYGLAYLEAVLRLGDHRASESEQRTAGGEATS